jgi:hypothetical protein
LPEWEGGGHDGGCRLSHFDSKGRDRIGRPIQGKTIDAEAGTPFALSVMKMSNEGARHAALAGR